MEHSHQNTALTRLVRNDSYLPFETVFIPDGEFELMYPKSSSSSEMKWIEFDNTSKVRDSKFDKYTDKDIIYCNEESQVPPYKILRNDIQDESMYSETLQPPKAIIKHNSFNCDQNFDSVGIPFRTLIDQSKYNLLNETVNNSPEELLPLTSISDKHVKELINNGSDPQTSKDPIFKSKIRALNRQQKVQYLKGSLDRICEVMHPKKNMVSNVVLKNNSKFKKHLMNTVINTSVTSSSRESLQKQAQSPKMHESHGRSKQNKTPNLKLNDSRECNIDGLKGCIIEASRTLIKTEKSLRVLGKLIHSDVSIEKKAAVNYLKNFHYTVNTFRKKIVGIEKSLSNHYKHLSPQISTKQVQVADLKNECQLTKENINCKRLLDSEKQFEILIPRGTTARSLKQTDRSTCDRNSNFSNQQACYPKLTRVQTCVQPTKRKIKSNGMSPKNVQKNRIKHLNWSSNSWKSSEESNNCSDKTYIQSRDIAQSQFPCESVIILD